jgi:hypothetical protein
MADNVNDHERDIMTAADAPLPSIIICRQAGVCQYSNTKFSNKNHDKKEPLLQAGNFVILSIPPGRFLKLYGRLYGRFPA